MQKNVANVFDEWAKAGRAEGMEKGHGFAVHAFLDELTLDRPLRFLDFGCGNGWVVRKMANLPHVQEAWGIDISKEMIERATAFQSSNEKFVCGKLEDGLLPGKFDLIFSMEALYYSVPMEVPMDHLVNLLAPQGMLVIGSDFYRENEESHSWPDDVGVPMDLRSMDEWKKLFESRNLKNVHQRQIRYPHEPSTNLEKEVHAKKTVSTWKQKLGTLFTYGTKKQCK